jgi:hypothetical protein
MMSFSSHLAYRTPTMKEERRKRRRRRMRRTTRRCHC